MAEVRGTKELLESQSIIDYISDFEIFKDNFTTEDGKHLEYNYFLVTLGNGDTIRMKPEKIWKASVYFCLKEGKKAV
jgi:hypothetical protein